MYHPKHVELFAEIGVPTPPRQRKVANTVRPVPDAAITLECAPDDG